MRNIADTIERLARFRSRPRIDPAPAGPDRLTRLYCRFAGMVVPGDTVTFTAERAGPGKLELRALNQKGEQVLTKATADFKE